MFVRKFWTKVMVSNMFGVIPSDFVVKNTLRYAKNQDIPSVPTYTKHNLKQLNIILDP